MVAYSVAYSYAAIGIHSELMKRLLKWLDPTVVMLLAVTALCLMAAHPANATTPIWSISTGVGVKHNEGSYLELAIQSHKRTWLNWKASLGAWDNKSQICGSATAERGTWKGEFGVCYGERSELVESLGKYKSGIWYKWRDNASVGLVHYSCNRDFSRRVLLGIDVIPRCSRGAHNRGANFLAVDIRR